VKIIKKIWPGLCFLSIGALFLGLFKQFPSLTDSFYTNGVFAVLRFFYDFTIGYLPFAFIYIVLPVLLYFLLKSGLRSYKEGQILGVATFMFNFLTCFLFLFYFFWGYNYYGHSVKDRMGLEIPKLDGAYLKSELEKQYAVLLEKRLEISSDSILVIPDNDRAQENVIRKELEIVLSRLNYSVKGKVRVRGLFPGALMRLRTSGIYIPYVFEGHFDSSIHPVQWNNTMAHEMAHGYGVTDEGECNFLAYLVCNNIDDSYVQYSGEMSYFRYLARAVIRYDNAYYNTFRAQLDIRIVSDLDQINLYLNKYDELMPKARDKIYDNYLKANGVSEGILSYDRMVELIAAERLQ